MFSRFMVKLRGAYLSDDLLANGICGNDGYVCEPQSVLARSMNLQGADVRATRQELDDFVPVIQTPTPIVLQIEIKGTLGLGRYE